MKRIAVIALGNPLMGDEGVGQAVLQQLRREAERFPGVDFLDGGTGGVGVLHLMAGRERAVFIDCAVMGERPGTIRRFTPDDVVSGKQLPGLSLHEGDLLKVIELARELGEAPGEIVIFGIQPASVEPRTGLSDALAERLADYAAAIARHLRTCGRQGAGRPRPAAPGHGAMTAR